ncbi:hypothetical protein U1Q18_036668, partial [Sarracenia purpurea var. burkii]
SPSSLCSIHLRSSSSSFTPPLATASRHLLSPPPLTPPPLATPYSSPPSIHSLIFTSYSHFEVLCRYSRRRPKGLYSRSSRSLKITFLSFDPLEEVPTAYLILQLKMMKLRKKWVNHNTVVDSEAHGRTINGEDNQVRVRHLGKLGEVEPEAAVGNVVLDAHVMFDKLPK